MFGCQWYWSCEYYDYLKSKYELVNLVSCMIPESNLKIGLQRLLEVDNRIVVPVNTLLGVIVFGTDVYIAEKLLHQQWNVSQYQIV